MYSKFPWVTPNHHTQQFNLHHFSNEKTRTKNGYFGLFIIKMGFSRIHYVAVWRCHMYFISYHIVDSTLLKLSMTVNEGWKIILI